MPSLPTAALSQQDILMKARSLRAGRAAKSIQMAGSGAHRTKAELQNVGSEGRAEVRGPAMFPSFPVTSGVGNAGGLDTRSDGPLCWS